MYENELTTILGLRARGENNLECRKIHEISVGSQWKN